MEESKEQILKNHQWTKEELQMLADSVTGKVKIHELKNYIDVNIIKTKNIPAGTTIQLRIKDEKSQTDTFNQLKFK